MEQYSSNALRQRAVKVTGGGKDEEGEFESRATGDVRFVACPNKAFPRYSFQTQHASGRGITLAAWKRLSKPLICLNKSQYLTTRKKTYCHVNYGRWLYCTTKDSSTRTLRITSLSHRPRHTSLGISGHNLLCTFPLNVANIVLLVILDKRFKKCRLNPVTHAPFISLTLHARLKTAFVCNPRPQRVLPPAHNPALFPQHIPTKDKHT